MERLTSAQLNSALQTTSKPSEKRLSDADLAHLAVMIGQTVQAYPSQDLADSLEMTARDYEALVLKYSLPKVEKALAALRIKPGQAFFPRPHEVAEEIENQRERGINDAIRRDGNKWLEEWEKHRLKILAERQEEQRGEA